MEIIWTREGPPAGIAEMPLQQSPGWGAALARLGRRVRRAEIRNEGMLLATAQLVTRGAGPVQVSLLTRGPVWLGPEVTTPEVRTRALRRLARAAGPLIATPGASLAGRGLLPLFTAAHGVVLDLRQPETALRAALAGKWRNRLVRAETAGLDIRLARPSMAEIEALLARDAAQQEVRGYRALPAAVTRAWQANDPGALLLAEAREGDGPVAQMLVLLHAPWASYHIGWSDDEGRAVSAHHLLLWRLALRLKARGFSHLDLGTVDTENAPGLARFKIGTGARTAPLGPTLLVLPG